MNKKKEIKHETYHIDSGIYSRCVQYYLQHDFCFQYPQY